MVKPRKKKKPRFEETVGGHKLRFLSKLLNRKDEVSKETIERMPRSKLASLKAKAERMSICSHHERKHRNSKMCYECYLKHANARKITEC